MKLCTGTVQSPCIQERQLFSEVLTPSFEINSPGQHFEECATPVQQKVSKKVPSKSKLSAKSFSMQSPDHTEITYTQQLEEKVDQNFKKVRQYFCNPSDEETESEKSAVSSPMSPALVNLPLKRYTQAEAVPVPPIMPDTLVEYSEREQLSQLQGDPFFGQCLQCARVFVLDICKLFRYHKTFAPDSYRSRFWSRSSI